MTDLWIDRGITPTQVGMLNAITGNIRGVVPSVVTLEEMVEMSNDILEKKGVTRTEIAIFDSQVYEGYVLAGSTWIKSLMGF